MSPQHPKQTPKDPAWENLTLDGVPDAGPGAGEPWEDARPFPSTGTKHSFLSGRRDSRAIRVHYYQKKTTRRFAGRAWFGPESEGPPGHAHGGSQAALLDEGMGAAAWLCDKTVLAAKIEINFRAPLPLGTILTLWSEITRIDGRKVYTAGRLVGDDGTTYSDGTGLFVVIDPKELLRKAGLG